MRSLRNFWFTAFFCIVAGATAQQPLTPDQFYSEVSRIDSTFKCKPGDYADCLLHKSKAFIDVYSRLDTTEQKYRKDFAANAYYNEACCYSLLKKKKQAFASLGNAVKMGYSNQGHALQDTDFDNIRKDARFNKLLECMSENTKLSILRRAGNYSQSPVAMPNFTYALPNDSNLVRVRRELKLDSIAGSGDEISKMKNILYFVHDAVRHDGSSSNPSRKNAIDLIEVCHTEGRGVNCRMMAQILNECYLAMGWASRYVTCRPADPYDFDCHVINAVFSNTLNKWVWMDPTFAAYVTDENGTLLGLEEVRARLINDQPLVLNEDANWNHKSKQTKEYYLDNYMAKNLYIMECPDRFMFDTETRREGKNIQYISLVPDGFGLYYEKSQPVTNSEWFWQPPY